VLQVHRDADGFRVSGAHREIELVSTGGSRYRRPEIALGDLVAPGGEMPADVLWLLREWSRTHDEITDWLNALRAAVGADLRLVVWDDTGFEIPWELLWLPAAAGHPAGWLGALLPVVRWTTLHGRSAAVASPYDDQPVESHGELVVYLIDEMAADAEVLAPYGPLRRADGPGLLTRLTQTDPRIGLVYVASHGTAEESTVRRRLGELRLTSLSFDPLPGLSASRSLVVLNACHSGRLFADPRLNDSLLRGFAEAFLRHGASAVIGTTGEVDTVRAGQVAAELLAALAGAGPAHVARALRDVRARIAAATPADTDDQRELLPFLSTFMYVCYGNALTTLRLGDHR
jgi:hypothetical protein